MARAEVNKGEVSAPESSPHYRADGDPPGYYPRLGDSMVKDPSIMPAPGENYEPIIHRYTSEGRSVMDLTGWKLIPMFSSVPQLSKATETSSSAKIPPIPWKHSSMFPDKANCVIQRGKIRIRDGSEDPSSDSDIKL